MRKTLFAALSMLIMLLFTACGPTPPAAEKVPETPSETPSEKPAENTATAENTPAASNSKILVAFFSRAGDNYETGNIEKGNTKIMAEFIAEKTGADLFEIKPVKEYPFDYRECTEVAKQELETNARPEIAAYPENLQNYDVIFLGYPIYWSTFPMIIYTFLENQDFNGKTIIPFCTSAGDYMTGKENTIPEIAKGSTIREGLGVKGKMCQENPDAVREKVNAWLTGLGY